MIQPPEYVNTLLTALRGAGYEAYPVGGCVRDGLMGRSPADWDVCTSARPAETEAALAGYRFIGTGMKHGTVTALTVGGPVEITTFRTEGTYSDGRRPDRVDFVTSLEADLARRDFTVNAMALAQDGAVIDPYGGQADLAAGLIRCVGDPDERFGEDALRILRALRFASKLDFAVEPATSQSVLRNRERLTRVAPERIFTELKGLLTGPGAGRVLREYGDVIFTVIPELAPLADFDQKSPHHIHDIWTHTAMAVDAIAPETALRLTMLLHDVAKPEMFFTDEAGVGHFYGHARTGADMANAVLRRLRCDNALRRTVTGLIERHDMAPPQTERSMRRLLAEVGEDTARQLIQCWRADSSDRSEAVRQRNFAVIDRAERALEQALDRRVCFSIRDLAVGGEDIMALGVAQGPAVGRILRELFRLVTEEELPNERAALLERAAALW